MAFHKSFPLKLDKCKETEYATWEWRSYKFVCHVDLVCHLPEWYAGFYTESFWMVARKKEPKTGLTNQSFVLSPLVHPCNYWFYYPAIFPEVTTVLARALGMPRQREYERELRLVLFFLLSDYTANRRHVLKYHWYVAVSWSHCQISLVLHFVEIFNHVL